MKLLVAFDFDHTIIHMNSDIVVEHLIPKEAYTEELRSLKKQAVWTNYMQGVFDTLHRNNVTKEEMLRTCGECESTEGMVELIRSLKNDLKADIVIISDSNTVFIEHWLKCKNIFEMISKIYTNPGHFNSDGLLRVEMYHEQDWCQYSTRNLCKSYVLEKHLEDERKVNNTYDVVAYVGDGANDLCPLLKLRSVDHCFPRIDYSLYKMLNSKAEIRSQIKASIHPWRRGSDILDVLKTFFAS